MTDLFAGMDPEPSWRDLLGLPKGIELHPANVRAAYREKVRETDPGDTARLNQLQDACSRALRQLPS